MTSYISKNAQTLETCDSIVMLRKQQRNIIITEHIRKLNNWVWTCKPK